MRLCIVGGGVTRLKAPFKSDAVIWSTMSVGQELPRVDEIFEIHDGVYDAEQLNKTGAVIHMKDVHPDVPKSKRFPIDSLIQKYGNRFNGTVVMMLAYAAMDGYEDIDLYGIDMSTDEEYSRRNMFYWMLGYLEAAGVKVTICPGGYMSTTCPTYCYDDNGQAYLDDMRRRAQDQVTEDESNIRALGERKAYMRGVLDTVGRFERRH